MKALLGIGGNLCNFDQLPNCIESDYYEAQREASLNNPVSSMLSIADSVISHTTHSTVLDWV